MGFFGLESIWFPVCKDTSLTSVRREDISLKGLIQIRHYRVMPVINSY